ncbi:MAG TPA: methylenetetrahydrofolate reductase [NAD(P)H] [Planctomycetota bacterium]|jgi:methylenetetrahydrofolate reductase (NADPH)
MRYIRDILAEKHALARPMISFEFFSPKTDEGDRTLLEKTIPTLAAFKPDFCSVTYGAGGTTQDKTLMITDRIQRQHNIVAMSHLTCVGATQEHIRGVLDQAHGHGIKNILALRGDPPPGEGFKREPGGFEFAKELVEFIREHSGFSVGVAGFPEGHIDCMEGKHVDWQRVKMKVDAGADFVITQLFFDNAFYFEFRDYMADKLGVHVPIIPGILPILSASQIIKFTKLCGAHMPAELLARLEKFGADDEATAAYGVEYATRQCESLLKSGAPGLHFYTLNKSKSTKRILQNLKLR